MVIEPLHIALFILGLPVVLFGVMAILHHLIPRHGDWLATSGMALCFGAALLLFIDGWGEASAFPIEHSFSWIPLGLYQALVGGVLIDGLTRVMLLVVTLVSFLVHLFSIGYMRGDRRYGRYYASLLLFTASMLGLVLANNLLYLFICWELVGLSSYLLIGHWYEKPSAYRAAIKAFLTTRVGDLGMFLALLLCFFEVGSLHYADLFAAVVEGSLSGDARFFVGLGLFFGAMGKSAQFPLHVWLPDAMEGPTPVSALIHAATMVAAGVYLIARLFPIFDPDALLIIAHVGALTALFAASIALVQDDIKKVLAYSTISQLGYMVLGLGVGGYESGVFHLVTHAVFKAGLFLGSGIIIHEMHHHQSMRDYGGLARRMPITALCYLFCTLALIGCWGFSGFWSKDAILTDTLAFSMKEGSWFLVACGFGTVFLTALYMGRQYFLTFLGKPRNQKLAMNAHDPGWTMLVPVIILSALAVVAGGNGHWIEEFSPKASAEKQVQSYADSGFESPGVIRAVMSNAYKSSVRPGLSELKTLAKADHDLKDHAHHVTIILSLSLAGLGLLVAIAYFAPLKSGQSILSPSAVAGRFSRIHRLLANKYYVDEFYSFLLIKPCCSLASLFAASDQSALDRVVNGTAPVTRFLAKGVRWFDERAVDGAMVMGSAGATWSSGNQLRLLQSGRLQNYLWLSLFGASVIGFVLCFVHLFRYLA